MRFDSDIKKVLAAIKRLEKSRETDTAASIALVLVEVGHSLLRGAYIRNHPLSD